MFACTETVALAVFAYTDTGRLWGRKWSVARTLQILECSIPKGKRWQHNDLRWKNLPYLGNFLPAEADTAGGAATALLVLAASSRTTRAVMRLVDSSLAWHILPLGVTHYSPLRSFRRG